MITKNITILKLIVALSIVIVFVFIFTNRLPPPERCTYCLEIMDFLYNIALATIAASIFYLIQVYLPEKQRLKIIKENFIENYTVFKKDCISIFLSAIGESSDIDLKDRLLDIKEFAHFFKENHTSNQTRWDGVLENLCINKYLQTDLSVSFKILSQEIDFFLYNVSIHDQEVFYFLKRLKRTTISLEKSIFEPDEIKKLSNFVWELFSGQDFTTGSLKNDIIKEMLNKVKN